MTFEELDREIELKLKNLNNQEEKECYLYIKNIIDKNIDTLNDFKSFDLQNFLIGYYTIFQEKKNLPDNSFYIKELCDFLNNIENIDINNFISTMLLLKKNNLLDDLEKYLNDIDVITYLNKLKNINTTLPLKIMNLKKKVKNNQVIISKLINEFKNREELIVNILIFYSTYQKMMTIVEKQENKDNIKITLLEDDNAIVGQLDIQKMISMLDEMEKYAKEYERVDRINQKEYTNLLNSKNLLQEALYEKKQILNYHDIIKNIKDLKIKYYFLKVIKEHNMKYLNELEEEYNNLNKDTKLEIIALLHEYGIKKNSYNIDIILRYNKEEILKILNIINIMDIDNNQKVYLLENANIDNVNTIKEYLDRGILNKDILKDNIDMFIIDNKLNNLKNNIDIIKKINLSVSLFINNISILLEDSKLFNKNINILSVYNLLKNIDTCDNFSFLLRTDLDTIIDKYLELDCEKYLENDLSLLNKNNLQKLEILKIIGIGVNSKKELDELLTVDNHLLIDENDMKDIFVNKEKISIDNIDINLENYKETNRVYNLEGIRVSIIKVNKLLSLGYNLYDAITYNMNLTVQDNEKLIKLLTKNNYVL